MNIKNLKPTEICIKATEETFEEVMQLLEKIGGVNTLNIENAPHHISVPLYIQSDGDICGLYAGVEGFTEITLSELRQMAGVEESKPDELAALRKENEELKAMYKECLEKYVPSEKWDEATNFLSTYGSGLAKDLSEKQI